jgi:hypothetical protein
MSIPLDRLYHYINNIAQESCQKILNDPVVVYYFYPHGSKDINNLISFKKLSEYEKFLCPELYCNDQEPLDYDRYENAELRRNEQPTAEILEIFKRKNITFPKFNFRGQIATVWDWALLLHSEKRSTEVDRYQASQFVPVYYWSHAVISLDWFRYAEHVTQCKNIKKPFLIYSRAWSGTREYRLRFAELLIHLNLQEHCKTSVNPIEPELGVHYNLHTFKNPMWRPQTVLENHFPISDAHSHYSADFDMEDYEATDIEVVLETLFDDTRLQLTEKSLRPIACGQPFILAGTHGSLEYLRSYGFKTFSDVWDESYDLVEDPAERLIQIAELMKYISNWLPHQRERNMAQAQAIADYNKQHFFSDKFFDQITGELKTNLTSAFAQLEAINTSKYFSERRKIFSSDPDLAPFGKKNKSDEMSKLIEERMQHYNMRSLNCVNK